MGKEIRLAKAGLLYADEVKLFSFTLQLLGSSIVSEAEHIQQGETPLDDYIRARLNDEREFSAEELLWPDPLNSVRPV